MADKQALVPVGSKYTDETALKVLEHVAQGKSLTKVSKMDGYPSSPTLWAWLRKSDDFRKAYSIAKEISAHLLEEIATDQALEMLEKRVDKDEVPGIRAAFAQLRWAAARRNPAAYGEKPAQTPGITVNIQTNVDLGESHQPGEYRLKIPAPVQDAQDAEFEDG